MDQLPPLKDVIERYGLNAKKSLGQHFLLDANITDKIVRKVGELNGRHVIEIGPGPGGLTRSILYGSEANVWAVERDDRAVAALKELSLSFPGRLNLIAEDAMEVDVTTLCPAPRIIISNLPYNIGTALLMNWIDMIDAHPGSIESMTLMFQKEVAERLTAAPRSKAYGRLSVITQLYCDVHNQMDLPASVFVPPPKVDSRVVTIIPKKDKPAVPKKAIETVCAMAFGQRRKMLRAALKPLGDIEAKLESIGIKPTQRAEEIEPAGFVKMAALI